VCVCVRVCEGVDMRCMTSSDGIIEKEDRLQSQHQGLQVKLEH
jgi:hypothetical protein